MKERPILFSGEMVRAILEGRKTQTRRVVKNLAEATMNMLKKCSSVKIKGAKTILDFGHKSLELNSEIFFKCPYGKVGDRLWVRESFCTAPVIEEDDAPYLYMADMDGLCLENIRWKPSIHMPREASRILLEITDIRVERLNDISEEDAVKEGLDSSHSSFSCSGLFAKQKFQKLWESINGAGSWEKNPWVWVVEFKVVKP